MRVRFGMVYVRVKVCKGSRRRLKRTDNAPAIFPRVKGPRGSLDGGCAALARTVYFERPDVVARALSRQGLADGSYLCMCCVFIAQFALK